MVEILGTRYVGTYLLKLPTSNRYAGFDGETTTGLQVPTMMRMLLLITMHSTQTDEIRSVIAAVCTRPISNLFGPA